MTRRSAVICGLLLGWMLPAVSVARLSPDIGWEVSDGEANPTVALPGGSKAHLEPDTFLVQGQRMWRVVFGGGAGGSTVHKLKLDGIQYTVAFYPTPPSTIFYIETVDPGFATPEDIRIGSLYRDVRAKSETERPNMHRGACVVCLPSRWAAMFDEPKSCRNGGLRDASVVRLLKSEGACGE